MQATYCSYFAAALKKKNERDVQYMMSNNYTLAHPGRSHPPEHRAGTALLRPWAGPGIWVAPGGRAVGAEPRVPRENQHLRRRAKPLATAPGRPPPTPPPLRPRPRR